MISCITWRKIIYNGLTYAGGFDSVFGIFLSDVLKFFNFGQDFKRWIDVLNKNVQASIF